MTQRSSAWLLGGVAVGVLVAAAAFVFYPGPAVPRPVAVRAGEQEIAWLYPATAPTSWNRFVMALDRAEDVLAAVVPGLRVRIDARTFPEETTSIPEAAIEWPDGRRLVFRWYRTTTEQDVGHWLAALVRRDPPPLAVLGGSTSDAAYRVLSVLRDETAALAAAKRPLMLLTTGTADRWIASPLDPDGRADGPADLLGLYPDRTFRFCFSNAQIARATCDFVWSQPDLRPDSDPAYLIHWLDDAYSRDLSEGYLAALHEVAVRATMDDQAWVLGCALAGGPGPFPGGVLPVHRLGREGSTFRRVGGAAHQRIDSSVGTFTFANRFELAVSKFVLLDLAAHPEQRRPLLAVMGQLQPCRRFLRAIVRSDPPRGRRLVVMTGDAVTFTTLYRDRRTHWPIQDFPFALVAFAHQNPTDPRAGFRPTGVFHGNTDDPEATGVRQTSQAGTDDLLLLEEVVHALGLAAGDAAVSGPDELARRLRDLRYRDGRIASGGDGVPLFDRRGQRTTGTGEHLVYLKPAGDGERVPPEATIEVYRWLGPAKWRPAGPPLPVLYDKPDASFGAAP